MDRPATGQEAAGGTAPAGAQGGAAPLDCIRRTLLENPHVWLVVADRDGTVVLWNRGAERISGYPRHEVLGRADVWERLFPDSRYRRRILQRCLGMSDEGEWQHVEVAIRRKDGRASVVLWHVGAPGSREAGGCLALGREVTDRAETVRVLDHPEAVFEKFLASLGVGVFQAYLQSPGRGVTANPALARMLGYGSTRELLNSDHERLFPPDERTRIGEQLRQHGAVRDFEMQLIRRDGTRMDVAVSAQADYDEEGRLRMLTGTVEDIGKRKAAQQALRASEEKYRQLIEGAGEPVFTVDEHGVLLAMNHVAARYAGRKPEDFEGVPLRDFFPPAAADAFMATVHKVIDSGKPHTEEISAVLQGKETWFQSRVYPLRTAEREAARVQVLALDITDRKRVEQEVLRYQERLRALPARLSAAEERERRRIAADLHDGISQSLALAIMKLGVLEGAMGRRDEAEALREVRELAEQALQAARSLTSELSPPVLAEFGFAEALEWLAERTGERYGLPVRVEHQSPPPQLGEQAKMVLFKAVRELLVNVAKHAQAAGASVTTRTERDRVIVTVADDGRGMAGGPDSGRSVTSRGFGLFNVHEQLGQLGGEMEMESHPGRGTRVILAVPIEAGRTTDAQGDTR